MALAEWFLKHYNSDVTGVSKAPLRARISKFKKSRMGYRKRRLQRSKSFKGVKKLQDVKGIKPDTKFRFIGMGVKR